MKIQDKNKNRIYKEAILISNGYTMEEVSKSLGISIKEIEYDMLVELERYFPKEKFSIIHESVQKGFQNAKFMGEERKERAKEKLESSGVESPKKMIETHENLKNIKMDVVVEKKSETVSIEELRQAKEQIQNSENLELSSVLTYLKYGYDIASISRFMGKEYEVIEQMIFEKLPTYNYEEFLKIVKERNWNIDVYNASKSEQKQSKK